MKILGSSRREARPRDSPKFGLWLCSDHSRGNSPTILSRFSSLTESTRYLFTEGASIPTGHGICIELGRPHTLITIVIEDAIIQVRTTVQIQARLLAMQIFQCSPLALDMLHMTGSNIWRMTLTSARLGPIWRPERRYLRTTSSSIVVSRPYQIPTRHVKFFASTSIKTSTSDLADTGGPKPRYVMLDGDEKEVKSATR